LFKLNKHGIKNFSGNKIYSPKLLKKSLKSQLEKQSILSIMGTVPKFSCHKKSSISQFLKLSFSGFGEFLQSPKR